MDIFQRSVSKFKLERITASDFVASMKTVFVTQCLALRTFAHLALGELGASFALLTNGNQVTQQNKFSQRSPQNLMKNVELLCAKD